MGLYSDVHGRTWRFFKDEKTFWIRLFYSDSDALPLCAAARPGSRGGCGPRGPDPLSPVRGLSWDSAGTYANQLTALNLFLLQHTTDVSTPGWTADHTLNSIGLKACTGNAVVSIEKHQNGRFIINTDSANPDYLYFDIGVNAQNMGKITDANGSEAELNSVRYSIIDSMGYTLASVAGKTNAFLNLDNLGGGFRLYVVATSRSGVDFSFEAPIVVKDKDSSYP